MTCIHPDLMERTGMEFEIVDGDLLDQPVDVIVNAWNRNIIPCPKGCPAPSSAGGLRALPRARLPLDAAWHRTTHQRR